MLLLVVVGEGAKGGFDTTSVEEKRLAAEPFVFSAGVLEGEEGS